MKRLLELVLRRHRPDVVALSALLDGQLDPAAAARLTAHVETCAICRGRTEELRNVRARLRATPPLESRRSFRLAPDMIAGAPMSRRATPARAARFAPYVGAAAALAFAVIVGADLYSAGGSSNGSATRASDSAQGASQPQPASGLTAPESGGTATDKAVEPSVSPPAAAPYAPTDVAPGPANGVPPHTGTPAAGGEGAVRDNSTPTGGETAPAFGSAAKHDESSGSGNNRAALHVIEAVIAAVALAAGAVAIGARLRERGA